MKFSSINATYAAGVRLARESSTVLRIKGIVTFVVADVEVDARVHTASASIRRGRDRGGEERRWEEKEGRSSRMADGSGLRDEMKI